MMLMDVNVLVYAHMEYVNNHLAYRSWLESVINSNTPLWLFRVSPKRIDTGRNASQGL